MKIYDFLSPERLKLIQDLKSPWREPINAFPPIPQKQPQLIGGVNFKNTSMFLAKTLKEAFEEKRNIILFGDFDVDGTTSAAIMYIFCRLCKINNIVPFVSKRSDGYGLNNKSIKGLLKEISNSSLKTTVIMMDMGVSSYHESEVLLQNGASVIVLDHHVPGPSREVAMENWNRLSDKYNNRVMAYDPLLFENQDDVSYSCLSAAGLVFKVCFDVIENNYESLTDLIFSSNKLSILPGGKPVTVETAINSMSKLCAIAQASDCMPFAIEGKLSESWILAKDFESGGDVLAGLEVLTDATITASRVPWVIGPRLNAAGRLSDAFAAFSLMLESDLDEAKKKLVTIDEVRTRVQNMTKHASTSIYDDLLSKKGLAVLIADNEKVKPGVVGIAASRASDKLLAPALYLCPETDENGNTILKGSMRRGPTNFSCEYFVMKMRELNIALSGGGHPAAAGISLKESELQRLLDEAEKQVYDIILDKHYKVSVDEFIEYSEKIEETLPFGKGHESAILCLKAILINVRPLTTSKNGSPEKWAYSFNMIDPDSGRSVDVKGLYSDMSKQQIELFDKLAEKKSLNIPVETRVVIIDNLKKNSKWSRQDIRILGIEKSDDNDLNAGLKEIAIRFLNLKDLNSDTDKVDVDDLSSKDSDSRPIVQIDVVEKNNSKLFLLRRPSKAEITGLIGEKKADELYKEHGGVWSKQDSGYIISNGNATILFEKFIDDSASIIKNNGPQKTDSAWRYIFSSKAKDLIQEIKNLEDSINKKKLNTEPFDIPEFSYIKTPLGFQYADVRLFLSNQISLCNNDMGTGKTLEACMWGLMHLHGLYSDKNGSILRKMIEPFNGSRGHPILIVTLKGVQGQLADEVESITKLKASQVNTTDVREFLSGFGFEMSDRDLDFNDAEEQGKKINPVKTVDINISNHFRNKYMKGFDFVVSTYDCLGRHPWILSNFKWSGIVLDEAHELKTINTLKTKAILGEKIDGEPIKNTPVLAMTGTFSKNRPADWFPWVRVLNADNGIYTGGSLKSAEVRFSMRFDGLVFTEGYGRGGIRIMKSERKKPENGEELRRILIPFVVRRLKTEIGDIPKIYVKEVRVPSNGLYHAILDNLENGTQIPDSISKVLDRHNLLSKDGSLDIEESDDELYESDDEFFKKETKKNSKSKLNSISKSLNNKIKNSNLSVESLAGKLALLSSLDKATGIINFLKSVNWIDCRATVNEPFVVLCTHRAALAEISLEFDKYNIQHFTMTQKDSAEQRKIKASEFQLGKKPVFLTTFGVGGTGLNLTKARRIQHQR